MCLDIAKGLNVQVYRLDILQVRYFRLKGSCGIRKRSWAKKIVHPIPVLKCCSRSSQAQAMPWQELWTLADSCCVQILRLFSATAKMMPTFHFLRLPGPPCLRS